MTFKEFKYWCNLRYRDGCWAAKTAVFCTELGAKIETAPLWKRNKVWRECNKNNWIYTDIVVPTNDWIKVLYGKDGNSEQVEPAPCGVYER